MVSDAGYRIRDNQILDYFAIKIYLMSIIKRGASKRNFAPCFQIGDMNRCKSIAIKKSIHSNASHRIRDCYGGQAAATTESALTDTDHRIAYGYGSQAGAKRECPIADAGHRIGDN